MRMEEIVDYQEIFLNKQIADLMAMALVKGTPGNVRNAAQSVYAKQQGHFFIAKSEEDVPLGILGYKTVNNDQIILMHIAVAPQERGKGIGRKMVETVSSFLKKGEVVAEVDGKQADFFKALGFRCILSSASEYEENLYRCIRVI